MYLGLIVQVRLFGDRHRITSPLGAALITLAIIPLLFVYKVMDKESVSYLVTKCFLAPVLSNAVLFGIEGALAPKVPAPKIKQN